MANAGAPWRSTRVDALVQAVNVEVVEIEVGSWDRDLEHWNETVRNEMNLRGDLKKFKYEKFAAALAHARSSV